MKKIMVCLVFVFAALVTTNTANAQLRVSVNIGTQPDWGPSGYDYAEYYYLPDIEAYYYVPRKQFVYMSNGRWTFSTSLPPRYSNYNLYSGYKVVLRDRNAYTHFGEHKIKYNNYRNYGNRQEMIRGRNNDNGNHYGQYKEKQRGRGRGHNRGHN